MRAWEELEGMPKYQVIRFQIIAPIKAAKTVTCVTEAPDTMPFPIVLATSTPKNAPNKFNAAAIITAWDGLNTRVETTVAIEFAVS